MGCGNDLDGNGARPDGRLDERETYYFGLKTVDTSLVPRVRCV